MRKNIVIIEHEPLTQKTKSNLFVEEFQLKGFKVQYWDISQYIFPGMQLANQIDDSCQIHFHVLAQIKDELSKQNIKDTIFIVEVRDSWNARLVYKLLSDVDAFTVRIDMYGNTFLYIPFSQKLKNLYFQDLGNIIKAAIDRNRVKYYKKINHIKNFSLLFSSSSLCADRVPINHPDYELYAQNSVSSQQGYIVFLDIYFPLHPDLIYMQRMHGIDVHEYQESLRIFFDKLENRTGKKIIIAAHPKALYNGNEFGKREIIKFDTVCLVQNADMVLLHTSNSISFPILYDKAIALITNHAYNKSPLMVSSQRKLASVLDLPIFNIDETDIESFSAEKLSSSIRNGYIYTYLTSKQSEHLLNKNIIVEKLSHIK